MEPASSENAGLLTITAKKAKVENRPITPSMIWVVIKHRSDTVANPSLVAVLLAQLPQTIPL